MDAISIINARIIDPETGYDETGIITIIDGMIADVGPKARVMNEQIDAKGLVAIPGLIDMRVITGEPGSENRETLETASMAAAAGGVTTLVVMPDTLPVIDDISLVDFIKRRSREMPVNIEVAGALTKNLSGELMTEIGLMQDAGAVMFSNGYKPIDDSRLMRRLLSYGAAFDVLIANRPRDRALSEGTCAHESDYASRLGLSGSPAQAELLMLNRDAVLAELSGCRVLVDMVSSVAATDALRQYKKDNDRLFASVSINHLAMNELDIGDYRTFAKLDPPLREERDREALLSSVNDGTIDVIVSAHDPRPAGEKRLPFEEASPGAVGLEVLLAAGLSQVADGKLDLMAFLRAVTINPAKMLGLKSGRIQVGVPGDIVLVDLGKPWVCDSAALKSASKNTPFDGRRMTGRALRTVCGGKVVYTHV